MDTVTAEKALADFVAERTSLVVDESLFRGSLPEGVNGAAVRFVRGVAGGDRPAEFTAEVRGAFDEPDEAREFAEALWGSLPEYAEAGFIALLGAGDVELGEEAGRFTAAGRITAVFA